MDRSFWLLLVLVGHVTINTTPADKTNSSLLQNPQYITKDVTLIDTLTTTDPVVITMDTTGTTMNTEVTTEVITETTEEPDVTTMSPTETTEEPDFTTMNPTEPTKEPDVTPTSPTETTEEPDFTTMSPEITEEPDFTTMSLETTEETDFTTMSPPVSTMNPSTSTESNFHSTVALTTLPLTTTESILYCENGGIKFDKVCICPDEWTGVTCSIPNFCNATKLYGFNFPSTPVGWFAYSKEKCPVGSSAAGKPQASTRCSSVHGYPSFSSPQVFQCDKTLNDIKQNLTNVADLERLAASTQILTSRPEELTSDNVTTAAQIANTLLLSPNATENVRVAAVATVSQLLNTFDSEEDDSATQSLTLTLDQLAANLSLDANTSQSQLVQPNLVVQSAQIEASDSQGVQFTSLAGTSGSFVANRIRLNTNTSKIVFEDGFISEALIYIRFPSGNGDRARQKQSNISLGFVLYQNDRFFPSSVYKRSRATVRVLSGSIGGHDRNEVSPHVQLIFKPAVLNGTFLHDFSCVYWDYVLQDWSNDGCYKDGASDGFLRCVCNHTTNFAALWSFREKYVYAEALNIISIVGLSFSILGLVVTIIHFVYENFHRKIRERQSHLNSKLALVSIYVSLLAFLITFLSGVQNTNPQNNTEVELSSNNQILDSDLHVEPDTGSCTAVAALLHFFLLATFAWNSMYGTQLVLLVRSIRRDLPPHWTWLSVGVGWGVPAVLMAITLAATYRKDNPLGYRQEEFCWLAAVDKTKHFNFGKPMFWAFLLPISLILIYNIALLVLTSLKTCKVDPNLTSTKRSSLTKKFLVSFSLAVILGLSWILGYLVLVSTGVAHLLFSIFFCVCTTTQGFQIFILFTARTPSFRANMQRSLQYISSVSNPLRQTTYTLWKSAKQTISETYREFSESNV